MDDFIQNPHRRRFLGAAISVAVGAASPATLAQSTHPVPASECLPGHATEAQTEGPFYVPRTPLKANFRADASGEPIVLEGRVLDMQCRPLAGAWLDFWHADSTGEYDNTGFRLRGHQVTDAEGRYRLETILPAVYPGRTRHIHVKLGAREGGRILTTQTYFPGEPGNARDSLYRPELAARLSDSVLHMDYVIRT